MAHYVWNTIGHLDDADAHSYAEDSRRHDGKGHDSATVVMVRPR